MRYAFILALAALAAAAEPAKAIDITEDQQDALGVFAMTDVVEQNCPQYRTNAGNVTEFMEERGVAVHNVTQTYHDEIIEIEEHFQELHDKSPNTFCYSMFDYMGESGKIPRLIERK